VKICFDNEIFWNQKFGGISSRYFFNLIKILSDNKNLNVKVFAKYYLNRKLDDLSKNIVIGKRVKFKPPFTGKIFLKLNSFFLHNEIKKFPHTLKDNHRLSLILLSGLGGSFPCNNQ
jgi:hypothetical protein